MKFKEFMANTLPRSKKSKRKCPVSPADSPSPARNLSPTTDCLNVVTCNKSLVSEDFRYFKDASTSTTPHPEIQDGCMSLSLNVNLIAPKDCSCLRQTRHSVDDYSLSDTEYQGAPECSDGNYNTIPRARSRIRTNPWLPSPKTSPPMSPHVTPARVSPFSSCTTSPLHGASTPASLTPESDSACMDTSFSACSGYSSGEYSGYSRPKRYSKDRKDRGRRRVDSLSDADSLLEQSFHSDMADAPRSPKTPRAPTSPISFEYERAMESTLESPGVGKFVGSRDSLNWANRNSGHMEDVFTSMKRRTALAETREEEEHLRYRASSEESNDSSGTLCNYIPEEDRVRRSPSPVSREELPAEKQNSLRLKEQKSLDSGFYSANLSDSPDEVVAPVKKRTVEEIRSSLQAKVMRLRQEKRLVDEKIREAQEEERIRLQNIAKFQKQVIALRKHVLLETLDHLRQRLANQSQRLQACYDDVLNQKWKEAAQNKRQKTLVTHLRSQSMDSA